MLRFEVECQTAWGEHVAVCGSGPLGGWEVVKSLVLHPKSYPVWSGEVEASSLAIEFKYILVRLQPAGPELVRWESDGPNRRVDPFSAAEVVLSDRFGDLQRCAVHIISPSGSAVDKGVSPATATVHDRFNDLSEHPVAKPGSRRADTRRSGLLSALEVEPVVRMSRLVRSKSGSSFGAKYEMGRGSVLGTGMSGDVRAARERASGLEVAIKRLPTTGLSGRQRAQVLAEVENQLSMDHPNICRLLEVYEEPERLLLVMERLRGPDLFEHLSRRGAYRERDAAGCARQMCLAVAYCHGRGVCHRDLKLENFCFEDGSEQARIKMIDFGLSALTSGTMTDAVGTLYYVAPEVLRGHYDEKCDMWSLGVVAFVLLCGHAPFQGRDDRETVRRIRAGTFFTPDGLSRAAANFLESLLRVDPDARLDARAALAHEWLAGAEAGPEAPLSPAVLAGMRSFVKGHALRRAFVSAVAPVATFEEVSRWADQFATLDTEGRGVLAAEELARSLRSGLALPAAEAEQLAGALAEEGGEVPYSAFLSACLSAHVAAFQGARVREFFERLDADGDGLVSLAEAAAVLGDDEELQELREGAAAAEGLTYEEFRWLLLQPTRLRSLQQLLREAPCTRADVVRARVGTGDTESLEAKRRENAAWRLWYLGEAEARAPSAASSPAAEPAAPPTAAEELLDQLDADPQGWRIATAAAKDGDTRAARLENLAWRKWRAQGEHRDEEVSPQG